MSVKTFAHCVRNSEVKNPFQKGFDESIWKDSFESNGKGDPDSERIYLAGIVVNNRLALFRRAFGELVASAPKLKQFEIVRAYCATSNRDRYILSEKMEEYGKGLKGDDNPIRFDKLGNLELTNVPHLLTNDVAEGCVDSYMCAIRNAVLLQEDIIPGKGTLDPLQFFRSECLLSNLYGCVEDYWNEVLWGAVRITINKNQVVFDTQRTDAQVAWLVSKFRADKLLSEKTTFVSREMERFAVGNMPAIVVRRNLNGRKTYHQTTCADIPERHRYGSLHYLITKSELADWLPGDLFSEDLGAGFSLGEIMEIWRLFGTFCRTILNELPSDTGCSSKGALIKFAPLIDMKKLRPVLAGCSGFTAKKVDKIIQFLTYRGGRRDDLWGNPLICTGHDKYIPMLAPVLDAKLSFCIDSWIYKAGFDVSSKGHQFEEVVVKRIKDALGEGIISDYEVFSTRILSNENGEKEEVDILIRVGRTILVGEAKCLSTASNPRSYYNTLKTIEGASTQVERKALFVRKNLKCIGQFLEWNLDMAEHDQFQILPCVIVSNHMCSGFDLFGAPITDITLLSRYFRDGDLPLLGMMQAGQCDAQARVIFYTTPEQAEANLAVYLSKPPQIRMIEKNIVSHAYDPLSGPDGERYEYIYKKLIVKLPEDLSEIMDYEYGFDVVKETVPL